MGGKNNKNQGKQQKSSPKQKRKQLPFGGGPFVEGAMLIKLQGSNERTSFFFENLLTNDATSLYYRAFIVKQP